ncbi:MAG TPA: hypothetical protein PKY77_27180 [Phycisphaerae bacterium]|nr:hypothetical protein [Phycisphaerae bacterium]
MGKAAGWLRGPANRLLVYDHAADRVLFSLPPENNSIWSLEWSSDAAALAEGRSNGELAVWNLEAVLQRLAGFRIPVASTIQELPVPMPIAVPSEQQPHAEFPSEQTFENTHPAN